MPGARRAPARPDRLVRRPQNAALQRLCRSLRAAAPPAGSRERAGPGAAAALPADAAGAAGGLPALERGGASAGEGVAGGEGGGAAPPPDAELASTGRCAGGAGEARSMG